MNIIYKQSKELKDIEINKMYKIIISNLKNIFDDFIEHPDDKKIWTSNIKKPICNFILCYEEDICAYLEYIKTDNGYHICEVQIDDKHKKDHITLKSLLKAFNKVIDNDSEITANINDKNKKSIAVFTHIGMINVKNRLYKMNKRDLEKWINN